MAEEIVRTDDIDKAKGTRTVGAETFSFSFDDVNYEIDLGEKNLAEFRKVVEPYIKVARVSSKPTRRKAKTQPKFDRAELKKWAAKEGIEVADRGVVKTEIVERFLASKK